jgi:hypothetical protein
LAEALSALPLRGRLAGYGILAAAPQLAYGVARQSASSELSMLVRVALFKTGLTLEAGVTGALKPR